MRGAEDGFYVLQTIDDLGFFGVPLGGAVEGFTKAKKGLAGGSAMVHFRLLEDHATRQLFGVAGELFGILGQPHRIVGQSLVALGEFVDGGLGGVHELDVAFNETWDVDLESPYEETEQHQQRAVIGDDLSDRIEIRHTHAF